MPRFVVRPRQVHAVVHNHTGVVHATHDSRDDALAALSDEFVLDSCTVFDVVNVETGVRYDTHWDSDEAEFCAGQVTAVTTPSN